MNWDSGHRTNYRVGYQGQYDLIIIDNAQIGKYSVAAVFFLFFIDNSSKTLTVCLCDLFIGVKHPNIICDGCSKAGIAGIRFRCAQCSNYDLCATCYGSDLHDLDHSFIRYQTTNSVGYV